MQRLKQLTLSLAAVMLAAGLLAVPIANAQSSPQAPGAAQPAPDIPDEKLSAAAAAIVQVETLKDRYVQRLSEAEADEKEQIVEEAQDAIERAVTDQGLSVEEYNSIITIAQVNPTVMEKLKQRLPADAR